MTGSRARSIWPVRLTVDKILWSGPAKETLGKFQKSINLQQANFEADNLYGQ